MQGPYHISIINNCSVNCTLNAPSVGGLIFGLFYEYQLINSYVQVINTFVAASLKNASSTCGGFVGT